MNNYNSKLIDIEGKYTKGIADLKVTVDMLAARAESVTIENLKELEERLNTGIKLVDDKTNVISSDVELLKNPPEPKNPLDAKATKKDVVDVEEKLDTVLKNTNKDLDIVKYFLYLL